MLALLPTIVAVAFMQGAPQEFDASKLPKVNGPRPPSYGDPARNASESPDRSQERRKSTIEAVALPEGDVVIKDKMDSEAGWKAYQAKVPEGQTVKVVLRSSNDDWFLVRTANRLGQAEKGMVPHSVRTIEPQTTYTNSSKEAKTVYFIVDTADLDAAKLPFTLYVTFGK